MKSFMSSICFFLLLFCFACEPNENGNNNNDKQNNSNHENENANNNKTNDGNKNPLQNQKKVADDGNRNVLLANMNENEENNNDEEENEEDNDKNNLPSDLAIPSKWNIKDTLDSLPLIDFRKFKSINNAAISEEEKEKDKKAQELLSSLTKEIQSKNLSKALSLRNQLQKEYHNTQFSINGAYQYAQYLETIDKEKAVAAYEWILVTWPESYQKWDAIYRLQNLQNMYMYLYSYGNYHHSDSTQISFQLSGSNLKEVEATIYRVDLVKMVEEGLNPQAPSIPDHAKAASRWTVKIPDNGNGWFYQQLQMPKLGAGHFILSLKSRYVTINSLFSTSDVSLLTKSDDRMLLCWAKDQKSRSLKNSDILVLKAGKIVYRGKTNDDGLFAAQMKMRENDSDNLHVIVDTPYGQAVSGSYYYWYSGYYQRVQHAYTDRPIYRPEQTVKFKGIFRERKQDDSIVPTKGTINLITYNQQWEKVDEKSFTMDEFGSIDGEYVIPKDAKLGQYYMQFTGNSYYAYVYFQVEEYKKPEYEVFVTTEKSNVSQTESMDVVVQAKYFFGEPVKEASVEYEVYEAVHWYDPYYQSDPWGWFHDEEDYYYRWNPYGNEQLIHRGTATLNEEGKANISITTRENKDYDLKYRVRASVIDKSRRKIDGSGSFLATRSSFNIAIKTNRWSYRPGETVKLEVLTQDYGKNPVSTTVVLKASKSTKDGSLEIFAETLTTDKHGRATYNWVVDENGYMYVSAEAKDKNGKTISMGRNVWVADNGWRSPHSYSGLNMELEKATYTPGEEIRGIITTGYADSYMLMTTETHRMQAYELVKLKGAVYTYNNTVLEEYEPYVSVNALMMESNALVQVSKKIVVPPTKSFLNVAVARSATYQPGQEAEYTIKITDSENKPVVAQFSFGLVDEAIYSMRADTTMDIRKAFYMINRGSVHTNTSYSFYSLGYGGKKNSDGDERDRSESKRQSAQAPSPAEESAAKEDMAADDEAGEADGLASGAQPGALQQPRVRTEFADSAVWEPNVVTDEMGIAKVKFTMPDNLTTWRATIRGITMSGKVGETIDKVITRKNLMARLQCPRTLTEQDEAIISGVIHNYLASEVNAVCRLKITGAKFLGAEEQEITLTPGVDKRVDWKILVTSLEEVTLELEALTTVESDAMRLTLPVVPYGIAVRKSDSGMTDTTVSLSLDLPTTSSADRAKLVVSVKPTLAGSMLESLEYLAGYPYGCVEQTMSRFLPSVIVAQTLQNLQMRHEKLEQELPKYLEAGTTRLYDFQHSDGGWGWWQNDQTNPLMTAYVIYGFAQAQKADFAVKSDVMSRGLSALKDLINKEENFENKCYMVFAYSEAKKPEQKWVDDLYAKVDEMTDYCRALLLVMAKKSNSMDIAQDLLKMLEKNAQVDGAYCHFSGKTIRYGWTDNPIETTAYCLKAIVAMNPKHPLIAKILKWLEIKKQGKHYQSTKDTAAVVFAFSDYLAHSDELNPNYHGSVTINGVAHEVSFKGVTANIEVKEFSVSPKLGENTITIQKTGVGKLYYSAYLEYYSKEKEIPATGSGIKVERKYFKLKEKKNESGVITYERAPMGEVIAQGEVFEVELTFSTASSYQYLMLQDYIPAGCEFEKDTSRDEYSSYYYWSWSNKEYRDDRLVVFFNYYSGENKIVYRLRAETPGTFYAMPARGEMMYFPEMRCNSTQNKLIISETR